MSKTTEDTIKALESAIEASEETIKRDSSEAPSTTILRTVAKDGVTMLWASLLEEGEPRGLLITLILNIDAAINQLRRDHRHVCADMLEAAFGEARQLLKAQTPPAAPSEDVEGPQYDELGPYKDGDEYLVGETWLASRTGAMVDIPYDLKGSEMTTGVAEESLRALGCKRRRPVPPPPTQEPPAPLSANDVAAVFGYLKDTSRVYSLPTAIFEAYKRVDKALAATPVQEGPDA